MTLYTFFTTPVNDRSILEPAYKNLLTVCENVEIVQAGEVFTLMGQCYDTMPAFPLYGGYKLIVLNAHNPEDKPVIF